VAWGGMALQLPLAEFLNPPMPNCLTYTGGTT